MTEPQPTTRTRAALMLLCFLAVSYVPLAIWVLATTQTPGPDPIEIGIETRIWMLGQFLLGPIAVTGPVSGPRVVIVAVVWSAVLALGIVLPRVYPVRILACLAALAWPLPAVGVWGLILT